MLVCVHSAKCLGIEAEIVIVELNIELGVGIHLVGLADVAVKESLMRTITALQSLDYRIPGKKIVINLAPADIHKKGSAYDLPIALGIVLASGQLKVSNINDYIIMGELGLDGSVRTVPGALPIVEMAKNKGYKACILPLESAKDAASIYGDMVYGVTHFSQVVSILKGEDAERFLISNQYSPEEDNYDLDAFLDFADIIGQGNAKRGLEIAASGGHNIIFVGPPGSGKSSLARAVSGILPSMSREEAITTNKIYSISTVEGRFGENKPRPFRAPSSTITAISLIGGSSNGSIVPGEISLAHGGVLFMDEFCELPKRIVESLRAPLEDGYVTISRLRHKLKFPSSFMLIAASNPCPCGYWGDGDKCTCTQSQRRAYLSKLSGPLIDRIDLQIFIKPVPSADLVKRTKAEPSKVIAERVAKAREIQKIRFKEEKIFTNSQMTESMIDKYCQLDVRTMNQLRDLIDQMGLSARSCSRILRMARTIADMRNSENISEEDILEAASYRFLDRFKNDLSK